MKNHEKEIKKLLSDEMLRPTNSFKKHLKAQVINGSEGKKHMKRSLWFYPTLVGVAAVLVFALTQVPLISNNNSKQPIVNLGTQKASAALIEKGATAYQANLKNVAFITNTETVTRGQQFACDQGGMGVQPGETWTTYVFMSKETGSEAYYQTKRTESGVIRQTTQYYNSNNTALSEVVTSAIGHPFMLDDGYYTPVDDNGKTISKDEMFATKKINGKNVYEVKLVVTSGSLKCGDGELMMRYLIDPATFATIEYAQYVNSFDESNLVYRATIETKNENLSEDQAIKRMEKAGFDKASALSEFPAQIAL